MPLTKTKAPEWADDFAQFIAASAKVAYQDLGAHWFASEWKFRLRQAQHCFTPDGGVLVDTDLLIGRDWNALELFDTITIRLPNGPGPVTLVTRVQIKQSLLAVVFGRFPPLPTAAPAPSAGQMNGGTVFPGETHNVRVEPGTADITLPSENDGGEYVDPARPTVNVITRREPDGLPIFVDLYAAGGATGDIIDAVLQEVAEFLTGAHSLKEIDALALKNPDLKAYVQDFGDDQDKLELKTMIINRRRELTVPAAAAAAANAPRRRVRAPTN